ncbi:MAG: universal stress protein, partial [Bacteroidota bacterium]
QARETLGLQHTPVVQSQVVVGMPATMIAETAKHDKTDLIIMGTRGEHGATDDLFGSQTTATLSRVHCPILVVPEGAMAGKITTVAYATDLDEATPFMIWETAKFLEPVHTILRLVHVQTKTEEVSPVKMNDIEEFFTDHAPSLQLTFHTISGKNVVQELNDFAKNWAVDLLVMHSAHRNFLERLFHKSTTREEVLHGKVPLLVLKD